MLGLQSAGSGIGEGVVEPFSIVVGNCGDRLARRIAVRAYGGRDGTIHKIGVGGMGEHRVIFAYDEHIPLAVHAFAGVVVGKRGIKPFGLVLVDGAVDKVPGEFVWRRLARYGHRCPHDLLYQFTRATLIDRGGIVGQLRLHNLLNVGTGQTTGLTAGDQQHRDKYRENGNHGSH